MVSVARRVRVFRVVRVVTTVQGGLGVQNIQDRQGVEDVQVRVVWSCIALSSTFLLFFLSERTKGGNFFGNV